jgi:hypothetical protein
LLRKSLVFPYPVAGVHIGAVQGHKPNLLWHQIGRIATVSDDRFSDYIARERNRLSREREEISNQKRELDNRLAAIDREFQALDAYQAAKTGKPSGGGRMQTQRRGGAVPGARSF